MTSERADLNEVGGIISLNNNERGIDAVEEQIPFNFRIPCPYYTKPGPYSSRLKQGKTALTRCW
jgi:hypothetical protein